MDRRRFAMTCLLGGWSVLASAQIDRRRDQGGGGGLPNGVYTVVSVDGSARNVVLRGADGTQATVRVPDGVYELSKLSAGDRVQVNFYVPDAMNPGLRAAGIWPAPR
jgi:hypothetical protein